MISVSCGYGTDGSRTPTMVAGRSLSVIVPADDGGVALEGAGPEPVGQHRGPVRLWSVIARTEQSPLDRPQAHDVEVRAANDSRPHSAGVAKAHHRELDRREVAERRERFHAGLQVADLRYRKVRVLGAEARRALPDVDEPVLVAIHQRPDQDAPDDAEDGGVGANPQSQGHDDGQREALGAKQRAKSEFLESVSIGWSCVSITQMTVRAAAPGIR